MGMVDLYHACPYSMKFNSVNKELIYIGEIFR